MNHLAQEPERVDLKHTQGESRSDTPVILLGSL